jgi:hypothetical protein
MPIAVQWDIDARSSHNRQDQHCVRLLCPAAKQFVEIAIDAESVPATNGISQILCQHYAAPLKHHQFQATWQYKEALTTAWLLDDGDDMHQILQDLVNETAHLRRHLDTTRFSWWLEPAPDQEVFVLRINTADGESAKNALEAFANQEALQWRSIAYGIIAIQCTAVQFTTYVQQLELVGISIDMQMRKGTFRYLIKQHLDTHAQGIDIRTITVQIGNVFPLADCEVMFVPEHTQTKGQLQQCIATELGSAQRLGILNFHVALVETNSGPCLAIRAAIPMEKSIGRAAHMQLTRLITCQHYLQRKHETLQDTCCAGPRNATLRTIIQVEAIHIRIRIRGDWGRVEE